MHNPFNARKEVEALKAQLAKKDEQVRWWKKFGDGQKAELIALKVELSGYRKSNASHFITALLGRGVEWYDYTKLDKVSWANYSADAQKIVTSETYTNEMKHYITDLIRFCAVDSKDFDAVMNVRASIVALETFTQRLVGIENPNKDSEEADPFEAL